jgi:hypothetical protein
VPVPGGHDGRHDEAVGQRQGRFRRRRFRWRDGRRTPPSQRRSAPAPRYEPLVPAQHAPSRVRVGSAASGTTAHSVVPPPHELAQRGRIGTGIERDDQLAIGIHVIKWSSLKNKEFNVRIVDINVKDLIN